MQPVKSTLAALQPGHYRTPCGLQSYLPISLSRIIRTLAWPTVLAPILLLVLTVSQESLCAQEIPPRLEARVRAHIGTLAGPEMRGRRGLGKQGARDYIIREFAECGAKPFFGEEWVQPVPGQSGIFGGMSPDGENIGACVRGTDPVLREEWIILNAHYDHLGVINGEIYPGADDNASGVAMLLEVARQVAASPLKRSVAFVAFDFEESLLWGSRWFIGHTPIELGQIKMCITADMIGRSLGGLGLPTVFVMGAEHSERVRAALAAAPVPPGLEVAQLGADMIGTRSDYGPFRDQEIPFLFFSTGEHPDYHSPGDLPEKIDYDKATRIIELVTELTRDLGNETEAPEWEVPTYQKLEEAKSVNRVTQQLIEADASGKIKLSVTQRFFVTQVQSKTGYMLRQQRVSDDERIWLARTAQLLLISVF